MTVEALAAGRDPQQAALAAVADAATLDDPFRSPLQVLAVAADGSHGGATTRVGGTYAFMGEGMREPEVVERLLLEP